MDRRSRPGISRGKFRKFLRISCADWNRLDDARQMPIQYLVSQPDHSRSYPPVDTTDRYAVMGFGLAALLIIVGMVLIVWRFWPQKSAS